MAWELRQPWSLLTCVNRWGGGESVVIFRRNLVGEAASVRRVGRTLCCSSLAGQGASIESPCCRNRNVQFITIYGNFVCSTKVDRLTIVGLWVPLATGLVWSEVRADDCCEWPWLSAVQLCTLWQSKIYTILRVCSLFKIFTTQFIASAGGTCYQCPHWSLIIDDKMHT